MGKRTISGFQQYLLANGIQRADAQKVVEARQSYRALYKRDWLKKKRSNHKPITTYYTLKEIASIEKAAKIHGLSLPKMVKEASLAYIRKQVVPIEPEMKLMLKEQLALMLSAVIHAFDEEKLEHHAFRVLTEKIEHLEQTILVHIDTQSKKA